MKKISKLKSLTSAVLTFNALPGIARSSYEAAMTVDALRVLEKADSRLIAEVVRESADFEKEQ